MEKIGYSTLRYWRHMVESYLKNPQYFQDGKRVNYEKSNFLWENYLIQFFYRPAGKASKYYPEKYWLLSKDWYRKIEWMEKWCLFEKKELCLFDSWALPIISRSLEPVRETSKILECIDINNIEERRTMALKEFSAVKEFSDDIKKAQKYMEIYKAIANKPCPLDDGIINWALFIAMSSNLLR